MQQQVSPAAAQACATPLATGSHNQYEYLEVLSILTPDECAQDTKGGWEFVIGDLPGHELGIDLYRRKR